jgi:hypothetical protein
MKAILYRKKFPELTGGTPASPDLWAESFAFIYQESATGFYLHIFREDVKCIAAIAAS